MQLTVQLTSQILTVLSRAVHVRATRICITAATSAMKGQHDASLGELSCTW